MHTLLPQIGIVPRVSVLAVISTLLSLALSPVPAAALTDYVVGRGLLQSYDAGQSQYGCYGDIYCYSWPAYYDYWDKTTSVPEKNVASIYMRDGDSRLVEIGYENEWFTWSRQGQIDSKPSWIFYAYENEPYLSYKKYPLTTQSPIARGEPGTWVTFEINNHAMTSSTGDWYAAWNGNTVLHGLDTANFSASGKPQVAAERYGIRVRNNGAWVDMRASFRYLQYKRPQGNWAPWNYASVNDQDDYWALKPVAGYTNRYYSTQDKKYPDQN